jgi:hypothetical protein
MRITVTVTASRPGADRGSATSAATEPVGRGAAPVVRTKPMIYGLPRVGVTVHATAGTWSPRPDSHRYEWRLDGELIPGATTSRLKVTSSMVGQELAVEAGRADGMAESKAVTVRG